MTCTSGKATFEVIAGSYEEFLLGYFFVEKDNELIQSFAAHDHTSSIRSTAISGHYLASGAADDRIFVYDLKTRKEHCMLTHHNSTVTCLQFTNDHTHLISGSSDGVLAIVRVGNWQLEKIWEKAHKGAAILDIAVHPSGKMALTLGSDCSLRTWNLVKGRQAYIINLNSKSKDAKSLEKIIWAPDGNRFVLYGGKYSEIWSIEAGGVLDIIEHDQKVSSSLWLSDTELLVGFEDGQIAVIREDCSKVLHKAHNSRVKAMAMYQDWIATASSTGEIKVWSKDLKELAKQQSGCRLTCMIIVPVIVKKEKVESNADEKSEEQVTKTVKRNIRSVVVEVEGSDDEVVKKNVDTKKVKKNKKRKSEIVVEEVESLPPLIEKNKKKKKNGLKKKKQNKIL